MLGSAERVLVDVVPHASEGVVRVGQVASEVEGDAGGMVQLEN
jgi:hypothetical protein